MAGLRAFQAYGLALFRAEAEEIVREGRDEQTVVRQLDELQERVTEHILGKEREMSGTVQ